MHTSLPRVMNFFIARTIQTVVHSLCGVIDSMLPKLTSVTWEQQACRSLEADPGVSTWYSWSRPWDTRVTLEGHANVQHTRYMTLLSVLCLRRCQAKRQGTGHALHFDDTDVHCM